MVLRCTSGFTCQSSKMGVSAEANSQDRREPLLCVPVALGLQLTIWHSFSYYICLLCFLETHQQFLAHSKGVAVGF